MSSKICVICDHETAYAKKLADYLGGRIELALQVKLCDDLSQVAKVRGESGIDILLTDETAELSEAETRGIPYIIRITEHLITDTDNSPIPIFRYQPADQIVSRMIEVLADGNEGRLWNVRKTRSAKLIGFYSPVKRLGQTAYALKKGRELAKTKNVLYISLETFAGIGGYFPEDKRNLSMLLYYAKQESGNPGLLITTLVKQIDGLDYIPPVLFGEDLKTVTSEEWLWLLREILNHSIYETVLLDLGDAVQGLPEILKLCDKVYMPVAGDRQAVSKIYQFEEMLCRQGYGEVWEKVIRCDIRRHVKNKGSKAAGSDKGSGRRRTE